ncbi:hypothetical protein D0Z07_8405 [Hyphodiscus hymeniophilus]|uniref:Uncharacterized protein n=1 Tax=Hyphodiscus hymeniophilus TaxID=353542 RepID=A0A9P6VEC5_9HELO|nr:hypothetical protein D0Z07_8405 [Hyphodiscus hymeniophilus]
MEPHELAIAALNQFANSSSRHRKSASATSDSSAPANRIQDNTMHQNPPEVQELAQQSQGTDAMSSTIGDSQEFTNNTTLGLQSASNSQSTVDGLDTPPTSTSDGFSSQSTNPEGQLSQLSQLAAAAEPMANPSSRPNLTIAPSIGLKRTADGQVKSTILSPTSPHRNSVRGHSRNTSAVSMSSTGSKIGEVAHKAFSYAKSDTDIAQLSSELRTRLTYAMVKVNNGWQSNSIDEVESLASQAGSPTSSSSTRRNLITSPRTNMANLQGRQVPIFPPNSIMQPPAQDFDLYSRNDPPSRTYESFWRDHSTSNPAQRSSQTLSNKLSLQPPADIRPTQSRRSHTPKFSKPPTIPGQGSNSSINTSTPRTPNGRAEYMEINSIHTPTQKTIQEQDAMEALLFMSSPGNSGNMGHAFPPPRNQMSPQQSPLRAEFNVQPPLNRAAQGRRVEFQTAATSNSTGSSEAGGYTAKVKALRRSKSDAIDRMLDEMADSSSDEEELVLSYQSPRRVAAGRV